MTSPVPGVAIGTPYRKQGSAWSLGYHTGVDYPCAVGHVVVAPQDSVIKHVGWGGWGQAYGLHVIGECVIGGRTYRWMTAHLSSALVRVGQQVNGYDQIGKSGATGHTFGPHVHFEARTSPFGFTFRDIVNPALVSDQDGDTIPPVTGPTIFDVCWWSMAAERYFGRPWKPRVAPIGVELRGEASVYGFSELYDESTATDILNQLGSPFQRAVKTGRVGMEFMFDSGKWVQQRESVNYPSGVQNRYAYVNHMTRRQTGQHVAFVLVHGPVFYDSLKTQYGQWLARLLGQIDGPIVLMGDVNRVSNSNSPRKEIQAAGFRTVEQQTTMVNESADEFPGKGDLADIWTRPAEAKIIAGELDLTSAALSDHRREDARVQIG